MSLALSLTCSSPRSASLHSSYVPHCKPQCVWPPDVRFVALITLPPIISPATMALCGETRGPWKAAHTVFAVALLLRCCRVAATIKPSRAGRFISWLHCQLPPTRRRPCLFFLFVLPVPDSSESSPNTLAGSQSGSIIPPRPWCVIRALVIMSGPAWVAIPVHPVEYGAPRALSPPRHGTLHEPIRIVKCHIRVPDVLVSCPAVSVDPSRWNGQSDA